MARIYVSKQTLTANAGGVVDTVISDPNVPSNVYGYIREMHFNNHNMTNGSLWLIPSGTQAINTPVWYALNVSGANAKVWYPVVYASAKGGVDISGTNSSVVRDIPVYSSLRVVMSGCGNGKSGTLYIVHETPA